MFLHFASDRIVVYTHNEQYILPFHHIDQNLSHILISLYKKTNPDRIFVLNGPGSFTNVRVGILAIEILRFLTQRSCDIFSIDKLSLFYHLSEQSFLPRYGIVYFGQRKNMAIVDCFERHSVITKYQDIVNHLSLQDTEWSQDKSFFVDYVVAEDFPVFVGHDEQVSIINDRGPFELQFRGCTTMIDNLFLSQTKLIPYYGIETSIG